MDELELKIKSITDKFDINGRFASFSVICAGHINKTYSVDFYMADGGTESLLLQNINTFVFKKPEELMSNVQNVTSFLKEKIKLQNGDVNRETLTVIMTKDKNNFYVDEEENYWRMYNFVENSFSYNKIEKPEHFRFAGEAFGRFQRMLADFPMDKLYETIPDFHNTYKRVGHFKTAVEENAVGRADEVKDEIKFVLDRADKTDIIVKMLENGELPLRVTHNDTKLNNVLFDKDTKKAICVVDLDTVMPGSSVYDFGDAVRFGTNTGAEDEKDTSKVNLDLELFRQYTIGYLKECGKALTEKEIECLPLSAWMMSFECGMRFLTDYLNGDVYFGIKYPEHNLDRCHTQFKLVRDMEEHMSEMKQIVNEIYASVK